MQYLFFRARGFRRKFRLYGQKLRLYGCKLRLYSQKLRLKIDVRDSSVCRRYDAEAKAWHRQSYAQ